MGRLGNHIEAIGGEWIFGAGKAVLRGQNAPAGLINHLWLNLAGLDGCQQVLAKNQGLRVFDIEASGCCIDIAQTHHPIRMHKALKAPLDTQNVCQKRFALPTERAVHLIIGTHDGGAACVQNGFEMRQIDFVQGTLINLYIHFEARILHGIERIMLDGRNHIVGLKTNGQSRTHFAQMARIFAISFLRPAPSRMPQEIDAHRPRQGAVLGTNFNRHGFANAPL